MTRHVGLLSLLAGALACGRGGESAPISSVAGPLAAVPAVRIAPASERQAYRAAGTVRVSRRAELSTRVMGRVERVAVRAGDAVRAGQVLVTLDRASLEAGRRQAQAALDFATVQLHRMERLQADSAVPQAQLDAARSAQAQAAAQVHAAESELTYASVTAPFDGIVTTRSVEVGDVAAPGRPLLVVEDRTAREIVVGVPDDLARRLHPGQTVAVSAGTGDRRFNARILSVVAGADPASRTVEVRLSGPPDLSSGVAAVAEFPGDEHSARLVPGTALVRRGQLTGVFLFTADSTLRLRWVRVGRETAGSIEVLSGLEDGDLVALNASQARDGLPARPVLPTGGAS